MHFAVIGMTGSGKTFGSIEIARASRARGRGTLVLHKPGEPWPADAASWQTESPDEFLRMFWASRNCDCFMELADADVGKFDERFHKCFQKGRHPPQSHLCYYLTQYGTSVHPRIRGNCVGLLLFAVNKDTAKLWAAEFNDDALLGAATLPPHEFFFKPNKFTPARHLKFAA